MAGQRTTKRRYIPPAHDPSKSGRQVRLDARTPCQLGRRGRHQSRNKNSKTKARLAPATCASKVATRHYNDAVAHKRDTTTKSTRPKNISWRDSYASTCAKTTTKKAISRPQPRTRNRIWHKTSFACHPCNLVGTRATPKRYRDSGPRRAKRYAHCHFADNNR